MQILNFTKNNRDFMNIIQVLDALIQIPTLPEDLKKRRRYDMALYAILNDPDVYQNVIHLGCLPSINENESVSKDFADFMSDLSVYITFDMNNDMFFAKVYNNQDYSRDQINNTIFETRQRIIKHLFEKKVISSEVYADQLNYDIKNIL